MAPATLLLLSVVVLDVEGEGVRLSFLPVRLRFPEVESPVAAAAALLRRVQRLRVTLHQLAAAVALVDELGLDLVVVASSGHGQTGEARRDLRCPENHASE
ncbi:hypothetical protein PMAYCL1PPCAC_14320 [Pristionchus mayeri]|uniref:Secreted protein n=1 Tax=Pristionchus mayeri TaxID=1317129 RepID=A0AAN4ZQE3_9BILA|nr:hypothetical protein PMAYCL1PPCAC_14320 [Pristionchus mayeri]